MADNYATRGNLQEYLGLSDSEVDTDAKSLDRALDSASRDIDEFCGRRFDQSTEARTYQPCRYDRLDVDDIATLTGLLVKVDAGNVGTYGTTLTIGTDFQVEPVNALAQGRPVNRIQLLTGSLPVSGPRYRVQVTATFGWPDVPAQVVQSTLLLAARRYKRKNSPNGFEGVNDFGPARISATDPDVAAMLGPFRLGGGVLVA